MYIPDLFGAYVKGRELAIAKNWDDLKNFESVENARNQNDLTAMDIWERRQQMPGKMNMFYNNVDISQMNTDVAREAHPGLIAKARMGSGHAQDQFSIWQANRDYGREVMNRGYQAGLSMMDAAGQNKAGQANYWLTDNRAYDAGGKTGQIAYDTLRGNSITAAYYPTVAQQQNTESNLKHRVNVAGLNLGYDQITNAHELVPQQHTLAKTTLANQQADASGYQARQEASRVARMQQQEFDRHRLIAETLGGEAGRAYLMGVMGIGGQTDGQTTMPAQTTQDTTTNSGATAPAATQTGYPQGTTPNGMPVDLFNQMGNTVGGGSSSSTTPTYHTPTVNSSDAAKVGAKVLGIGSKQAALHNADFAGMAQPIVDWNRNAGAYYANNLAHYNPLDVRYWQALGNSLFPNGIVEKW